MSKRESEPTATEEEQQTLNEADSEDPAIPVPPDGGWGWVVVLSSFMVHIIADGVVYSFGVFYVEFLNYFKGGRGETGWVGSLVVGVTLSSGPIASALTNKYGCRAVTIAGAIVAAAGFIISLFAPSIFYLYFSFGILSGLGLGLIYLPAIVSVTYYFEKRRAFATGLAVCGSGIGTFIFAPVAQMLLNEYGWRGAILIEAGLLLNCCVCGALFRPLEAPKRRKRTLSVRDSRAASPTSFATAEDEVKFKSPSVSNGQARIAAPLTGSAHSLQVHSVGVTSPEEVELRRHASDTLTPSSLSITRQNSGENPGLMYRKDILYSGSLANIPMYKSSHSMYVQSVTSLPQHISSDKETCRLLKWMRCSDEFKDTFREMLDLSLLKDLTFMMFAISNLFTSIGFNVPYIYLPDRAILEGIPEDKAAFLISVIGIANTCGRVLFGWLSDIKCINRLMLYNTALFLCGICTALSCFCKTYPLMIAYSASFGLFIGTYVSLTSVILVDLLGINRLTNAFGLLLLFQGVATIIGPPIAGWVYDGTKSYDASFWITGTMIGISGFMLYFIPCVKRYQERRHPASQTDVDMGMQAESPQPPVPDVLPQCK